MRSIRPIVTLLGIFALGTSVACGGSDSPADDTTPSEPTAAATMPPVPSAADAGSDTGDVQITQGQLPEGYPSDVPTYPGSTPGQSMIIPGAGGLVSFTSSASDREVFDFYEKQLAAQGWTMDSSEAPYSIQFSKGERKADVRIAKGDDGTEIMITLEGI